MKNETILSIDFGTSNSLVGGWSKGKRIEALALDPTATDATLMRTLLYFPHKDLCFYGNEAIQKYLEFEMEGRLFRSFKSHLPNRSYLGTFIDDRTLTLENMIGIFLLELKKRSEHLLNTSVSSAVIGRPARYSMDPMSEGFAFHRMKKAAEFAGFENVQFVPEPLAAAFEYRRNLKAEKIALIGDFGGGTSDFTLIRLGPYSFEKSHVLGLSGCPLAGDALDSLFMSQKLNDYFGAKSKYKVPLGQNTMTMPLSISDRLNKPSQIVHLKERATYEFIREVRKGALTDKDKAIIDRLFLLIEDQQIFSFFEAIEHSKRELSHQEKSEFNFTYPGLETKVLFLQTQFELWAQEIGEKIFSSLNDCLSQSHLAASDVDLVFLTGGSAQVPLIRKKFEELFGVEKLQTGSHFHSVLSGLTEAAGFLVQGIQF